MKRDMDLVRQLLIETEGNESASPLQVDGIVNAGHVDIMIQAGLIKGKVCNNEVGMPCCAVILGLTWYGHEFLSRARNDTVWNSVKSKLKEKLGDVPFEALFDLLKSATLSLFLS